MNKVAVVIPAYNEANRIASTLSPLTSEDFDIIIVDDGSTYNTKDVLKDCRVYYLRHDVNLGQGAALLTGTQFAIENGAQIIAHFDADNQHRKEDLLMLIKELKENSGIEIILGSRFISAQTNLPAFKKLILSVAKIFSKKFLSLHFTDPQSGLRAFRSQVFLKILWHSNDFLHCTEILSKIVKNKVVFKELPIEVNYNTDNQNKMVKPKISMGWKLLMNKIVGKL